MMMALDDKCLGQGKQRLDVYTRLGSVGVRVRVTAIVRASLKVS